MEKFKKKRKPPSHQGPSKFTFAENKGEIEFEGHTNFPPGLADEHANAGVEDERHSQINPKENMDEVGESLCIMVSETIVRQTGNGRTSIMS